MNRYFTIYHGLTPGAPWGVAVEKSESVKRTELLLLCRTEGEAVHLAEVTSLGLGLKQFRDEKVAEREAKTAGAN